ncbi:hypothetical protein [Sorangium sp. So ce341]|uniref:hypothetical protein n=1 Tax=Sorangium sp. So ce341 TaxID=3133302 RepID=UPI003F5ED53D
MGIVVVLSLLLCTPARIAWCEDLGPSSIMPPRKYQEAEALLLPAWELNPTFDVAYNLGNTEYQLKKYREAAQYLSFALRHWPLLKGVAKLKPNAEKWLAESRAQVGAVGVTVSMAGAEVPVEARPRAERRSRERCSWNRGSTGSRRGFRGTRRRARRCAWAREVR